MPDAKGEPGTPFNGLHARGGVQELRPGDRIGAHELIARLSGDHMGRRWLVRASLSHPSRVMTILGGAPTVSREDRERIAISSLALMHLRHPHVVPTVDVRVHGDRLCLVQETGAGTSLTHLRRKLPHRAGLSCFSGAARGLATLHEAGIQHLDFGPDAVFVDHEGGVRVGNAGLVHTSSIAGAQFSGSFRIGELRGPPPAGRPGRDPAPRAVLGHPSYLAPELHLGLAHDARADQYAFCVAAYEALSGHRPFAGATVAACLAATYAGELRPLPPSTPAARELEAVFRRGLAFAPQDRFESMAALIQAWPEPA